MLPYSLENKNASDKMAFPLDITEVPYIRVSSVATMETCPKSWAAKFLVGLDVEEPAALVLIDKPLKPSAGETGTAVHVITEEILIDALDLQSKGLPPDMHTYLTKHIPEHPALAWVPVKTEKDNIKEYVKDRLFHEGETIMAIELGGQMPWAEGEPSISYHIDLLMLEGNHTITIVDHKTNRSYEDWQVWSKKPQQMLYAWIVSQLYPGYRIRWRIGYVNQPENVTWLVDIEENNREIMGRLAKAWGEVKTTFRTDTADIASFRETANNYCNYCPVRDICETYTNHTLDFEVMKDRLLGRDANLADTYEKLKLVAKLVKDWLEDCEKKILTEIASGKVVKSATGSTYIVTRSSRREIDFMPAFLALNTIVNDNSDSELWDDIVEMSKDMFTFKVGGLDKLIKKHPQLKPLLEPYIKDAESDKDSIKSDAPKTKIVRNK